MSWRDRYTRASFRGIPFEVRRAEGEGGRRQPEHLFPSRDRATYDDLGRRPRVYQIEGYLIGPDYDLERTRLWLALEAEGPGRLVHPYYGTLLVLVPRFRFSEETDEGGMARVTFEAREAVPFVQARVPNARAQARAAGDELEAASGDRFVDGVDVDGLEETRTSIAETIRGVGRAIERLDVFRGPIAKVAQLSAAVRSTIDEAASLAAAPALAVTTVFAALEGIQDAAQNALGALNAYRTLFDLRPAPRALGPGHISRAINGNLDLAERLVQAGCLAGWVEATTRVTWETQDQAEAARTDFLAAIDQWSEDASDAELSAVGQLVRTVMEALPVDDEKLPRLGTYRLGDRTNTLVLTWGLYGDLDEEARLIERNRIPNPAVVPGGLDLEVLIRG